MEIQTKLVDGIHMRWLEEGEGVPVVLVHGLPTGPRLWRHVIPRVQGGRCLAWNMIGYAPLMGEEGELDIGVRRQADYLWMWLKDLGIEQAVLVGHDLGGGAVQILSVHHPEACAGLVLTNSICYDSWPIPSIKLLRTGKQLVRRLSNPRFKQLFKAFMRRGHDDRAILRESMELHWGPYARVDAAAAFVRQIESLEVGDTLAIAGVFPRVPVPARVVWGAADGMQRVRYGELLAEVLDAPLVRLEGAKHFVPEDHPEELAEAINQVVAAVAGIPAGAGAGREQPSRGISVARAEAYPAFESGGELGRPIALPEAYRRRGDDVARGLELLAELGEVPVEGAPRRVAAVYRRIAATLRVPVVNLLFRTLANAPAVLEGLWQASEPWARSRAFEGAANRVRAQSVLRHLVVRDARLAALAAEAPIVAFTDTVHYVMPKLLLLASAWDQAVATSGAEAAWPLFDEQQALPLGVAPGTLGVELVDPAEAREDLRRLLETIADRHHHPAVASYYRGLANWPQFLAAVWAHLGPLVTSASYQHTKSSVIDLADRLAADAAPEVRRRWRTCTGSAVPPAWLRPVLAAFRFHLIPDVLIDVSAVERLVGGLEGAERSRFAFASAPA